MNENQDARRPRNQIYHQFTIIKTSKIPFTRDDSQNKQLEEWRIQNFWVCMVVEMQIVFSEMVHIENPQKKDYISVS